jgi:hypothetical protein
MIVLHVEQTIKKGRDHLLIIPNKNSKSPFPNKGSGIWNFNFGLSLIRHSCFQKSMFDLKHYHLSSIIYHLRSIFYHLPSILYHLSSYWIYCANEILTCKPALVFVIGNELLIFGIFLFCSKYSFRLTRLLRM